MVFLALFPAGLSMLVLSAHFLRSGNMFGVLVCLVVFFLLFVPRTFALRVVQAALAVGFFEWVRTLVILAVARSRAGEPAARLIVILGVVAAVTLGAALALQSAPARRHFGRGGG